MSNEPALWRQILRTNFSNVEKLADFLELTPAQRLLLSKCPTFTLDVPLRLAKKMAKGRLDDPLVRQFLPLLAETQDVPGFELDAVGDQKCRLESKLLKKYSGRALLVTTSACAMHCRYCFRQNFDYVTKRTFIEELEAIRKDVSIHEVILSGGDPLSLDNKILAQLFAEIGLIEHVKRVRFHTRFPIGIPERIDDEFLDLLRNQKCQIWFVTHINHPLEMDVDVCIALKKIQKLGIPILNQSVLLKGVNDSLEVLQQLCETLVNHGIQPYYLHQLDREKGIAHFEVSEVQGKELIERLSEKIAGYGVPKYVREVAGAPGKISLT